MSVSLEHQFKGLAKICKKQWHLPPLGMMESVLGLSPGASFTSLCSSFQCLLMAFIRGARVGSPVVVTKSHPLLWWSHLQQNIRQTVTFLLLSAPDSKGEDIVADEALAVCRSRLDLLHLKTPAIDEGSASK